jgi:hypothetical protein
MVDGFSCGVNLISQVINVHVGIIYSSIHLIVIYAITWGEEFLVVQVLFEVNPCLDNIHKMSGISLSYHYINCVKIDLSYHYLSLSRLVLFDPKEMYRDLGILGASLHLDNEKMAKHSMHTHTYT